MKIIKIVDLLNKKANGEEMPEKIAFDRYIYIWLNDFVGYCRWDEKKQKYIRMSTDFELTDALNEYAQIIDEKKLPEKIGLIKYCEDQATSLIHHKVDEIIDYLDYLESKEKGE